MSDNYGISQPDRFFADKYHILTHSIKAERFFTWLRSRGVFNQIDQEDVETKYPTTYLRAGHLIDIIRTKGQKGFVSFMQVLEWEFPHTFSEVVKREPTLPPIEFRPKMSIRRSNISDELMPRLVALIKDIDTKMTKEQRILNQQETWMQQFQMNLREEDDKIQEERESYERQVEALNYKLEQTLVECAEKENRLASKCRSEAEFKGKVERLSEEKEKLLNRIGDLSISILSQKKDSDVAQAKLSRGRDVKHPSDIDKLRAENAQLKERLDRSMEQLAVDDSWLEDMGTLRARLRSMVDKNNELDAENSELRAKVKTSEAKYENLQEKHSLLQQQITDAEITPYGSMIYLSSRRSKIGGRKPMAPPSPTLATPGDHAKLPVMPPLGRPLSELSSTATDVYIYRSGFNYRFRSLQFKSENTKLEQQVKDRDMELCEKKVQVRDYEFHVQSQQAEIDFLMTPMRGRVNAIDRTELLKRLAKEPVTVTLSKIKDLEQRFDAPCRRPSSYSAPLSTTRSPSLDSSSMDNNPTCSHCVMKTSNRLPTRKPVIKRSSLDKNRDDNSSRSSRSSDSSNISSPRSSGSPD